jgi:hyperosmotically inducible protein
MKLRILNAALAAIAVALSGCAADGPPETKRTTGEFTSDAALTARVKSAIATDVGARTATAVNVTTYNGTVQLTGFVDNNDQKSRAEQAAKKVDGVKSVKNDIRIKSAS